MNKEDQFTLTAPDGSVIATGSNLWADEVAKVLTATADLEEIERKKTEFDASAARIVDGLMKLATDQFSRLEAEQLEQEERRADEARQRAKAEAAAEQQRNQAIIDAMPDPDSPYFPSGDLHTLPAKDIEPEDPTGEVLEDDEGPVPLTYGKLPLSYVKGEEDEGSPVPGEPIPPKQKPSRKEIRKLTELLDPDQPPTQAAVSLS